MPWSTRPGKTLACVTVARMLLAAEQQGTVCDALRLGIKNMTLNV
ncbi:hypothetical protein [Salmonella enterica]|nr:hypothetical protein [Salmonella enterica]